MLNLGDKCENNENIDIKNHGMMIIQRETDKMLCQDVKTYDSTGVNNEYSKKQLKYDGLKFRLAIAQV